MPRPYDNGALLALLILLPLSGCVDPAPLAPPDVWAGTGTMLGAQGTWTIEVLPSPAMINNSRLAAAEAIVLEINGPKHGHVFVDAQTCELIGWQTEYLYLLAGVEMPAFFQVAPIAAALAVQQERQVWLGETYMLTRNGPTTTATGTWQPGNSSLNWTITAGPDGGPDVALGEIQYWKNTAGLWNPPCRAPSHAPAPFLAPSHAWGDHGPPDSGSNPEQRLDATLAAAAQNPRVAQLMEDPWWVRGFNVRESGLQGGPTNIWTWWMALASADDSLQVQVQWVFPFIPQTARIVDVSAGDFAQAPPPRADTTGVSVAEGIAWCDRTVEQLAFNDFGLDAVGFEGTQATPFLLYTCTGKPWQNVATGVNPTTGVAGLLDAEELGSPEA